MPARPDVMQTYVKGKRYRKAAESAAYCYELYKEHLVPSNKKKHEHELFCRLTVRHITKTPQDVDRHVNGKKFQRALARWKECEKTGVKFVPRAGGRKKRQETSDT